MARYTTIFFDVGNTLLQTDPPAAVTIANVVKRERGIEIDPRKIDQNMNLFEKHYAKVYSADENLWSEHELQMKMWLDGYRKLLEAVGVTEDLEPLVNAIYNEYDKPEVWATFPKAIETLEELKSRGYKIGIISNWGWGLKDLLDSIGFAASIDLVICSADVNTHKPLPEIFEIALEKMGSTAEESIHVGDHTVADVDGAAAVGITPVLIKHREGELLGDLTNGVAGDETITIGSLHEMLRVVDALNAE